MNLTEIGRIHTPFLRAAGTPIQPYRASLGLSASGFSALTAIFVRIAEVDILDDTPLLDIKPYLPQYDNYPVQHCGWVDTVPDRDVIADDRFERQHPLPRAREATGL